METEHRILMIGDLPSDAKLIERRLRAEGMSFVLDRVTATADLAGKVVDFVPGVILLAPDLPHDDAMATLESAKKLAPQIPLILIIENHQEETAIACMKAGADDYVLKESLGRLGVTIEKLIERNHAEAMRQTSENAHGSLVDNLPHKIFLKDQDSVYLSCNKSYASDLGLDPHRIPGMTDDDFYPPDLAAKLRADDRRVLESGKTEEFDQEYGGNGDRVVAHTVKIPVRGTDGNVIGVLGVLWDITERTRAEAALRHSEERYRRLFETAQDGIILLDADSGDITDVNPFLLDILGYSREQLLGKKLWDIGLFQDTAECQKAFGRLQEDGYIRYEHLPLESKGGRCTEVEFVSNIYMVGGEKVIQCNVRDISERRRAEAALQQSEERYRRLFETAQDGIILLDAGSGDITDVNPFLLDMLGYSREQLLGKKLWDIGLFKDTAECQTVFSRLQEEGYIRYEHLPLESKGGRCTDVEFVSNSYHVGSQRVIQCNVRDISESRQAQAENLQLLTAIEQASEAIYITDLDARIRYANPAFTRITGYSRDELIGQRPSILKSDKQDVAYYQDLWKTILSGKVWHGELVNRRKNGTLYALEMTITPVRNAQGAITNFIAIKEEVTERNSLEEQLRQARKMEAIGRLAGGVAHDFNNLLTIITGYTDILLVDPKASVAKCAEEIRTASQRAVVLTRQLLAFSRRQVLLPRVLNLNEVIANLERMLQRLIGEDIELSLVQGENLGSVKADPGQIEQVIMNLALNARDAMTQGGKLTIATANASFDEVSCKKFAEMPPGAYVMFSVSDNGSGMDEQVQTRIFEPFFTTKQLGKGTGLGLATVYGIVKQSGGAISVDSAPKKGSTFTIYLPLVSEKPEARQRGPTESRSAKDSGGVLLVEDEPALRSLVKSILKSAGYTVLEASDPVEALNLFGHAPDSIDLLLTDIVMPQMSGITLAERLLSLHRETKVLYMSGYTDELLQEHGVTSAAFIQKPFTPEALRNKVREMLKNRTNPERRQYARFDFPDLAVKCERGDLEMAAQCIDLSEGGILLQDLYEHIPMNETLRLSFTLSTGEQPYKLGGRVVRVGPAHQVAVEFEDLSSTERAVLHQVTVCKGRSDAACGSFG